MDVRVEGVSILGALNIDPEQQRLMFVKFMGMFSKAERRAYVTEWIEKRDDPAQRTIFLNNIVEALDDDEVFIRSEGRKAFFDIEEGVQKKMFTRFLTTVDKATREGYILEWVVAKNNSVTREEFLQKMYEILMDDEDYIQFEGRKALDSLRIPVSEQRAIFSKFLTVSSVQDRKDYITEWRRVRRSRSKRNFFLKNFIGLVGS